MTMRLHITLPLAGLLLAAGFAAQAQPSGQAAFEQTCAACHQPDGKGVPDAFPALAGNSFVQGPAEVVAQTVLDGRNGMPSFRADLTDDQLAAILTYVRSAWGNSAPAIPASLVASVRNGAKPPGEPGKAAQPR
jgi:cytochrome c6